MNLFVNVYKLGYFIEMNLLNLIFVNYETLVLILLVNDIYVSRFIILLVNVI